MRRQSAYNPVRMRFFLPPEDLQPYVTTIYQCLAENEDGSPVEDRLHPEWANIRLIIKGSAEAAVGDDPMEPVPPAVMVGPTSKATRFRITSAETWGIGLLPLGWLRLTDQPANEYADQIIDLAQDPAFLRLGAIVACVEKPVCDPHVFQNTLVKAMRQSLRSEQAREREVITLEHALIDRSIHSVGELAEATGMSLRTLERLSNTVFGFSPQMLLRRQRFLRTLAQFMLDPSMKWIDTLDSHYHDQAHFVRDCKYFMGMGPSAYAKLTHPVLSAAAHGRKALVGEAMQVLHRPPAM